MHSTHIKHTPFLLSTLLIILNSFCTIGLSIIRHHQAVYFLSEHSTCTNKTYFYLVALLYSLPMMAISLLNVSSDMTDSSMTSNNGSV